MVHIPIIATPAGPPAPVAPAGETKEGAPSISGGAQAPPKPPDSGLTFHPSAFGLHGEFAQKASEKGVTVVEGMKQIVLTPELRKRFEDVLEVFASQLEEYQRYSGKPLAQEQQDFLNLYRQNKSGFLNDAKGWILANLVMEQEMYLRLAMLQKDIQLRIQGMKPISGEVTITKHDLQGFIHEHGLDILKYTVGLPVTLPLKGIQKFIESARLHERMTVKVEDFAIDISRLPPEYRDYMDYIDPKNTNPRGVATFLAEVANARLDFYQALGVNLQELEQATPWASFRGAARAPAVSGKLRESLDTSWIRVRDRIIKEMQAAGEHPPGVARLNLANPTHVAWFTFEAQRRTIRTFSSEYLKAVAQSQENTSGAMQVIDQRLQETASPQAVQKAKDKKIAQLKERIAKIKGKTTAEGTEVPGELSTLQKQLAEAQKELEEVPTGGKSLKQELEEARVQHRDERAEVVKLERTITQQQQQVDDLRRQIPKIEDRHNKRIDRIRKSKTYTDGQALYHSLIKAGLRPIKEIQSDMQRELALLDQARQQAITGLGTSPAQDQIDAINHNYQTVEAPIIQRYQAEIDLAAKKWKQLESFQKQEAAISAIEQNRNNAVDRVEAKVDQLEDDLGKKRIEMEQKRVARDKLKAEYDRTKAMSDPLETKIRGLKRDIKRKEDELGRLAQQLAEAEKIDTTKLDTKTEKKRRMWTAIKGALTRYDTVVSEVQSAVDAQKRSLEVVDLTLTRPTDPGYGQTYLEGYLRTLDHLFQWETVKDRSEALKIATQGLPSRDLARILHDRFNLGLLPPQRSSLAAVFTAMGTHRITSIEMGEAFTDILAYLKRKGLLIR